jgi:hypothetical protein
MPNPKGHEESIKDSRFKAAWHSGPTRTIRVPIALAEVTLEYARQLDRGIEPRDTGKICNNGTDTVIVEPRDTRIQFDSPTHNKVDNIVAEPRDTKIQFDSPTHNQVDNIVAEPRDTATIQSELDSIRANYDALLETSARITTKLRDEVDRLRSALELPEASVLLNKLKAKRKKSTASLADVDAILEILEES